MELPTSRIYPSATSSLFTFTFSLAQHGGVYFQNVRLLLAAANGNVGQANP